MGHLTSEQLHQLRQIDALTYLRSFEPDQLVRVSGDTWCTKEHDSLKLSNGKWYWFSRQIGGRSALDYLIKVQNLRFHDAAEILMGHELPYVPPIDPPSMAFGSRKLKLPELSGTTTLAVRYLIRRGIAPEILDDCVRDGLLLETKKYHNAVFVGFDQEGTARYAALRGTVGSFKGEASGSDKRFSFLLADRPDATEVHICESAIDALSYATLLHRAKDHDWRETPLLSLGGISGSRKTGLPLALGHFLEVHGGVKTLVLHLDNDEPGRQAARDILAVAGRRYEVQDRPPTCGKDVNDYLLRLGRHKIKSRERDAR